MNSEKKKSYFKTLFIICTFSAAIDGFYSFAYSGLSNFIPSYFGISNTDLFFFTMIGGIGGVLSLSAGALADKIGRKKAMIFINFGFLVMVIITFMSQFFHPPWFFLVWYFVWNFITLSDIWVLPVIEESPAKKRGKMQGLIALITGPGVIPIALFILIASESNWQILYYIGLIVLIPGLILNFRMDESKLTFSAQTELIKPSIKENYKKLFNKKNKTIVIVMVVIVLSSAIAKSSGQYDVIFMRNVKLWPQSLISLSLLLSFPISLGIFLGLMLSEKYGRKKCIIIFGLLAFLFKLIYALTFNIALSFIFYLLKLLMNFCSRGVIALFIAELFPTDIRGTSNGLSKSIGKLSLFLTPLFGFLIMGLVSNLDYASWWPILEIFGADPTTVVPGVSDYAFQTFSYVILFVFINFFEFFVILIILLCKPMETAGKDLEELHRLKS